MATVARMPMPTDASLLTLMQWFSPSYPVGAFSYSHGLEWAALDGQVTDGQSLGAWVETVLRYGGGASDARFLAAAYHAKDQAGLLQHDAMCRAFAPSAERLNETVKQGAAFCKITADVWGHDLPELCYPIAVGHAAALAGLALVPTSAAYLHSFAANLIAAGQRLAPVGQTEAQTHVARLTPLCQRIAEDTQDGDLDALSSTAFAADIASMQHETQYSRIFQT